MTKEEMLKLLKESNALNVKKAEDTIQNIDAKQKQTVEKAEGVNGLDSELPTQKDVEKEVNKAIDTLVPADKDGVSKDGGECDTLMSQDGVENAKKKQDNSMKDVINVSSRKVEEASEANNDLLAQLKEAAEREEGYKKKIADITKLCEKALTAQKETLTKEYTTEMANVFEAVIAEGEKLEKELVESAAKNEKLYKTAHKLYESSNRLNKILLEAVKKAQPEKELVRYTTPAYRAVKSLNK